MGDILVGFGISGALAAVIAYWAPRRGTTVAGTRRRDMGRALRPPRWLGMRATTLAFAFVWTLGCSSSPDEPKGGAERCVEGQTIECACPGGSSGVQTCNGRGAFGECACDLANAHTPEVGTADMAIGLDSEGADSGGPDFGPDAADMPPAAERVFIGDCTPLMKGPNGDPFPWVYLSPDDIPDTIVLDVPDGTIVVWGPEEALTVDPQDQRRATFSLPDRWAGQLTVSAEPCGFGFVQVTEVEPTTISVVLLWETPSDANELDNNGTDLDLHFLRDGGTWNAAPDDIYWLNPTTDWGVPDDPSDDPRLTIDDTNGLGPELLLHNRPEVDVEHHLGAYYYASGGFGQSRAVMNVWHGTELIANGEAEMENDGAFWHFVTVSVDGQNTPTVTFVNTVENGFP